MNKKQIINIYQLRKEIVKLDNIRNLNIVRKVQTHKIRVEYFLAVN
jgi:hypothetical protein